MSRRMYPTRMCISCKHVIDIEEDVWGRDYITCECDECKYEDVRGRMNRLNRIVDVLNEMIAECMYVMIWIGDEDKRRKGMEGIERVVKERSVWEGIRECVRGRVKG